MKSWNGPCFRAGILLAGLLLVAMPSLVRAQAPREKTVYVVAIDAEYAPFEFVDAAGRPTGYTVSLLNRIGDLAGVSFHFLPMHWPDAVAGLESGRVDLVNMIRTPERERMYEFSEPHSEIAQAIFSMDDVGITGLDSLSGRKVAFQEKDVSLEQMGKRTDIEKVLVRSKEEGFLLLNAKKVDAFMASEQAGLYLTRKYNLDRIRVTAFGLYPQPFGFASRKGNTALVSMLNTHLRTVKADAEYGALVEKWLYPVTKDKIWLERNRSWILGAGLLLAVIAAAASLMVFFLRTRLKRRTLSLQESEERARTILHTAMDGFWVVDMQGRLREVNETYGRMSGYSAQELLSMRVSDLEAVEAADDTAAHIQKVMTQGEGRFETRHRRKDGNLFDVEICVQYRPVEGGRLVAFLRDITGRKRAEEELRISEEMFKVLSDQSPLGMALIDGQGRYEYVNPAFEAIFGYTLRDLPTGAEWFRVAFPDAAKREEVVRVWKEDLAHVGVGESRPRIFDVVCKGGASKSILFRPVALQENRQLVIYEDITERRKMESQLQQATKMEAVGRLAGGIAHDFNNILTVISGYCELLLQKVGKGSPMHGEVEEIKRAGDRAALMTQQLLAFSRKQIIEPKVVRLDRLVAEVLAMLARLIGEDIALQATTGKSLGSVKIDPGQFQQILMNLVVNARDAMPGGGKIVIETANVDLDEGYCALHPYVKPGRFVMLAVCDTGRGMSDEVKAHIFEPFFTTKERGSGTGLGLATTYGAVKQSGGSIEVYSEVGIGTTFKIYLPRVEEEAAKPVNDIVPADLPGGTETVLLVEDEDTVRNLGVRILRDLGYRVMSARNGAEAIALAMGCEERIDLLLTDVVMPGMNGSELATQLVLRHPGMKVLFTSGYTDDAIVRHGVLDEGVLFIGKPYSLEGLARKVREVFDRA